MPRRADGVLAQPAFANSGSGYVTATTVITGNGKADIFQTGKTIILKNVRLSTRTWRKRSVLIGIDDVTYRLTKIVSSTGSVPNLTVTCEY